MIGIGADHGGFELKNEILKHLQSKGFEMKDFGCYQPESIDYPDVAKPVCEAVLSGECEKGILICGTGIGISITANKYKGIRAALCSDNFTAGVTREHNDTNIICFGGRVIGPEVAKQMAETFLTTEFSNDERHIRRIKKIEKDGYGVN